MRRSVFLARYGGSHHWPSPHNPKVAGSNPAPATMNDEGLADAAAASPFRLPRLHPGIGKRNARVPRLNDDVLRPTRKGALSPRAQNPIEMEGTTRQHEERGSAPCWNFGVLPKRVSSCHSAIPTAAPSSRRTRLARVFSL